MKYSIGSDECIGGYDVFEASDGEYDSYEEACNQCEIMNKQHFNERMIDAT